MKETTVLGNEKIFNTTYALGGTQSECYEFALALCHESGPIPGPLLDLGLAILRTMEIEEVRQTTIDFVLHGVIAWVHTQNPKDAYINIVCDDLMILMPESRGGMGSVKPLSPEDWLEALRTIENTDKRFARARKRILLLREKTVTTS